MARVPSPEQSEQLLAGAIGSREVPYEVAGLVRLFAVMSAPAAGGDDVAQEQAVASIAAAIRSGPTDLGAYRASRVSRFMSAKATAAAVAIVLGGGTAAAAATGTLPAPAQHFVSRALSHVHIGVPDPGDRPGSGSNTRGRSSVGGARTGLHGHGGAVPGGPKSIGGTGRNSGTSAPGVIGLPKSGLCNNDHASAIERSKLDQAAAAAAAGPSLADSCSAVTPTTPRQTPTSTTTKPGKPTKPTKPAKPVSHPNGPPATTARHGGSGNNGKANKGIPSGRHSQ